ncbi:tRNA (adenosine(37)-N6)-dimethylallyltransferase MiaA [Candidatus Gottesmanbacteria bacterium]|nr:tRNA (adenosine(37)-N6)-dimethylallyltransferase MiaA [Candidatus Gottesmanbacteria bacterium]
MNKLLIICGPTATGKTKLGIRLAKKLNGEIISADSRQVYKGMDIGTGKDFKGAWLLDVVKPNQEFSVAQYVELAWKVISDIFKRKKLPILVGGTGFYIKAIIDGIETLGVPPDWELREKLSHCSIAQLSDWLNKLDKQRWERMNESDRNNPRRLIRAIEIARYKSTSEVGGTPPAGMAGEGDTSEVKEGKTLFIGLTTSYPILYQRIDQRVEERVKQGVEKEIRQLLSKGYSWENSVLGTTIGYREWKQYFIDQNIYKRVRSREPISIYSSSVKDVIQQWKFAEHGYARRQLTWFKKDKRIQWFDITISGWQEKIEKLIDKWYNEL